MLWGRRGKGDADDFMLAGRNIGLALSTATLMASWVTGNTTLLAPEFGYRNGLWGMFSYALAGLGLILFVLVVFINRRWWLFGLLWGDAMLIWLKSELVGPSYGQTSEKVNEQKSNEYFNVRVWRAL